MLVYSSINVPGTEFISLDDDPLPSCLNTTEPHVVGNSDIIMRPAVVKKEGIKTSELAFRLTIRDIE